MKLKKLIFMILAASSLLVACQKSPDFVSREETGVTVDCIKQTIEQNVMARGDWFIDMNGVDWITVSPDKGTGNGTNYQMLSISVEYNKGGSREGTFYVCQGSTRCPVTIHQSRCKFGFEKVEVVDSLFRGKECKTGVNVYYNFAAGDETAKLSATINGEAASGLSIEPLTSSDFKPGSGAVYLPIAGTPAKLGVFEVEVFAEGKSIGKCNGEVFEYKEPVPVVKADGLPVKWNFFDAGLTGTAPLGTEMGKFWTYYTEDNNPRVLPTSGNGEAVLTAEMAKGPNLVTLSGVLEAYTYNPAIQVNGLLENDYWLARIPVYHFTETTKISVAAAVSSAAKGAGYYVMEYSANGKDWIMAPGGTEFSKDSEKWTAHFWNTANSTTNWSASGTGTRKHFDRDTDDTYHKYIFETKGIDLPEGTFYLRLRMLKYKYDNSATIAAAWTDLKILELEFVE